MINYYKTHSKFRIILDRIDEFFEKFTVIYWTFLAVYILAFVLVIFCSLPTDIRTPVASFVGGIFSVVIVPMSINKYNNRVKKNGEIFKENKNIYVDLTNVICSIIKDPNQRSNKIILNNFIEENRSIMILFFKSRLIDDMICLLEELDKSTENTIYYCEKIIKKFAKKVVRQDHFQ